jgi:putative sigma-54 modulation protein
MQIIISGRNVDVADGLRTHIEDRFARLSRFESRASRVEVTLAEEKNRSIAEAVLSVDGAGTMFAKAEAPEVRTAVDRLYDKLSRRAKKGRDMRRSHKSPDPGPFPAREGESDE